MLFIMKKPTTKMEIHSFLGASRILSKVCVRFLKIGCTLDKIGPKESKVWMEWQCEQSFVELKRRLTTTPIFTLPDGKDEFLVYIEAVKEGFRCVLMQKGKVIAYASR